MLEQDACLQTIQNLLLCFLCLYTSASIQERRIPFPDQIGSVESLIKSLIFLHLLGLTSSTLFLILPVSVFQPKQEKESKKKIKERRKKRIL